MGRPVYSVLVYLTPEPGLAESPYLQEIPGTGLGHHFTFQVIMPIFELSVAPSQERAKELLLSFNSR